MITEARSAVRLNDLARGALGLVGDSPRIAASFARFRQERTIGAVLQRRTELSPNRPFLRSAGTTLTYAQCNAIANRYAGQLRVDGVEVGDTVAILGTNSLRTVLAVLAATKIGAVAAMLNHNQRGKVLEHSIAQVDPKILLVDPLATDAFETIDRASLLGEVLDYDELDAAAASRSASNHLRTDQLPASATAFYIFTSGTTGMSKASIITHRRWLGGMYGFGALGMRLRSSDVIYTPLPLYHNNSLIVGLGSALVSGACLAIGTGFSASKFWDDIVANEATAFCYIGELCRYLLSQPARPTDRAHGIRVIVGNGLRPDIWEQFTERFGIDRVIEFYAASEFNSGAINFFNVSRSAGFSVPIGRAIVEYDEETGVPTRDNLGRLTRVAKGAAGLLVLKDSSIAPFDGYTDTVATRRKLVDNAFEEGDRWVNTGDLVRDQGYGHLAFVDRLGDTFRWKGENVATTEVEAVLGTLPAVEHAAVYGVEVAGTDGKAGMAAIQLATGAHLDIAELAQHLGGHLPRYAVPLFIRIVEQLAQTSTFKNMKGTLRTQSYLDAGDDAVFVFAGPAHGYVPFYAGYPADVANGTAPA